MTVRCCAASCSSCTRDPVGVPAAGARLRVRDDVLAAAADWREAGDWQQLRGAADGTECRRGAGPVQGVDRQLARAGSQGRPETGPSPADRTKPGSKHHLITEGHGIPLAVSLTGGNRSDVTQLMPLIQAVPPVRGRPRRRPPRLGVHRWVVEQSIALLHWFRRLRILWEIRDDIHQASSARPAPSSARVDCGTSHLLGPLRAIDRAASISSFETLTRRRASLRNSASSSRVSASSSAAGQLTTFFGTALAYRLSRRLTKPGHIRVIRLVYPVHRLLYRVP